MIHSNHSETVDHVEEAFVLPRRPFSFAPGDICSTHFFGLCAGDLEIFRAHQQDCSDCYSVRIG